MTAVTLGWARQVPRDYRPWPKAQISKCIGRWGRPRCQGPNECQALRVCSQGRPQIAGVVYIADSGSRTRDCETTFGWVLAARADDISAG